MKMAKEKQGPAYPNRPRAEVPPWAWDTDEAPPRYAPSSPTYAPGPPPSYPPPPPPPPPSPPPSPSPPSPRPRRGPPTPPSGPANKEPQARPGETGADTALAAAICAVELDLGRVRGSGKNVKERTKLFRKMQLSHHPDKHPGNEIFAGEVFKYLMNQRDWFLAELPV